MPSFPTKVCFFLPFSAVGYVEWLFWLFTLNSCLNPWIYLAFNPELVQNLFGRGRRGSRCGGRGAAGAMAGAATNRANAGAAGGGASRMCETQVSGHKK